MSEDYIDEKALRSGRRWVLAAVAVLLAVGFALGFATHGVLQ